MKTFTTVNALLVSILLTCSAIVVAESPQSMTEAATKAATPFLKKIKPDPAKGEVVSTGGSSVAPFVNIAGKKAQASQIFIKKDGGIFAAESRYGGGFNLGDVSFDKKTGLKVGSRALNPKDALDRTTLKELGGLLLDRFADEPEAKNILNTVYGLDLDKKGEALSDGIEFKLGSLGKKDTSHDGKGLLGADGRPQLELESRADLVKEFLAHPDNFTGDCKSIDECIYTHKKGMGVLTLDAKDKLAIDMLMGKSSHSPAAAGDFEGQFDQKLVTGGTMEELLARLNNLPADKTLATVYVGAEWCGPCRQKKASMLSGSMAMPDLIAFHGPSGSSEIMGLTSTIPKIMTFEKVNGKWSLTPKSISTP